MRPAWYSAQAWRMTSARVMWPCYAAPKSSTSWPIRFAAISQ